MRRTSRVYLIALVAVPLVAVSMALAAIPEATDGATPRQQIAALKKQIRVLKAQVKDLQREVKFLNGRVATLQEEAALIPQLAEIAAATARYRDVGAAVANGYVHAGVDCIPTVGVHYVQGSWPNDDVLDPLQPEFLMYAPTNAGLKLVAVEYAVPARLPRPQFLGGVFERYAGGPGEPIWYLHIWLWQLNPAGLFSPLNRTVEC